MKLFDGLINYFFGYTFIEQIAAGQSYSTNIKMRRNFNGGFWAGKISRPLPDRVENFRGSGKPYIRTVDFRDFDQRASLGFRLAKVAGLKSLKFKIISKKLVRGFKSEIIKHGAVDNNIFLTEFKGQSLTDYLRSGGFSSVEASDIINKDEAIKSFIFNLWIGNYDNKDRDFLVDENKNLISTDYHESGPGFRDSPDLALGAFGEGFDMNHPKDTGWCIGDGFLRGYLINNISNWAVFGQTIKTINKLPKWQIKYAMRGLNFYTQGTMVNINNLYFNFLLERRPKLEQVIKKWIAEGCPLTTLPKDNGVL